ncbi:MAG: hypothetical protein AAF353_08610, partial [Pseudomonadota bacterium]
MDSARFDVASNPLRYIAFVRRTRHGPFFILADSRSIAANQFHSYTRILAQHMPDGIIKSDSQTIRIQS